MRADGKERIFTPVEHARMKSAPDALVAGLNPTLAHEILGQSVDYRQAWITAAAVMRHVTGRGAAVMRKAADKVAEAVTPEPEQAPGPQQMLLF